MKRFALITGASGGIGQAVARDLAKKGYNLYLHFNSGKTAVDCLIENLAEYGGEYIPIQGDFSVSGGYRKLLQNIFSIDDIIHCGGNSLYGLFQDLDDEEAARLFHIHVLNPMMLTRSLLPKLLARKDGSIIFISSIWGQTGAACEAAYSSAKGAQIALMKALAKELAPSGIRVNAIAPGAVETQMLQRFSNDEKMGIEEEIPMGRLGLPEEIANGVSFLLSGKASYITGQVLAINGGWHT